MTYKQTEKAVGGEILTVATASSGTEIRFKRELVGTKQYITNNIMKWGNDSNRWLCLTNLSM